MFQVLPALPRKQDNEFNQPLITGAVNSPEEMEITRFFFLSFIRGLIGTVVACWQLAFFGFYFIFFCVCIFLCRSCLGSRSLAGIGIPGSGQSNFGKHLAVRYLGRGREAELTLSW